MKKVLSILLSIAFLCCAATACIDQADQASTMPDNISSESMSVSSEGFSSKKESGSEPIVITAAELSKAYEDDKDAAEKNYEGKTLDITGRVRSISSLDNIHLDRETKSGYINCAMNDSDFDADIIQKGDVIRVRGKMADGFLGLKLEQCEFLEVVTPAESSSESSSSVVSSETSSAVSSEESPSGTISSEASSMPSSSHTENPLTIKSDPPIPDVSDTQSKSIMVWVTSKGKKYHSSSSCSNMKNPHEISIEEAESSGRTPCSKCY